MPFRFSFVYFMAKSLQRVMFPGFVGIYDFSAIPCRFASFLLRHVRGTKLLFFSSPPPTPRNAATPGFYAFYAFGQLVDHRFTRA